MVFKASPVPVWPSWAMLGPKLRPVAGAMERFDDWNQRIPHLGVAGVTRAPLGEM